MQPNLQRQQGAAAKGEVAEQRDAVAVVVAPLVGAEVGVGEEVAGIPAGLTPSPPGTPGGCKPASHFAAPALDCFPN